MPKSVLLLDPPSGRILETPFGTLPALAGALIANGHKVQMADLNTALFYDFFNLRTFRQAFRQNLMNQYKGILSPLYNLKQSCSLENGIGLLSGSLRKKIPQYLSQKKFPSLSFRMIHHGYAKLMQDLSWAVHSANPNEDCLETIKRTDINPFFQYYTSYLQQFDWKAIDLVGITANKRSEAAALTLAWAIRKIAPEVSIVLGGPLLREIDFQNEWDMIQLKALLENGLADYLVIFEGESALLELLDRMGTNNSLHTIPNLLWMENGTLNVNQPFYSEKVNSLALYSYDGFDIDWYPGLAIEISRGCYWAKCAFCSYCYLREKRKTFVTNTPMYQCINPKKVVESIEYLKKRYGHRYFDFTCLDVSPPEMNRLCNEIIDSDTNIDWGARLRLDKTLKPELFHKMAHAGATYFHLHPETLTQRTADLQGKGYNVEHIKELLAYWEKNRADFPPLIINVFTGFPGETLEDFQETFEHLVNGKYFLHDIHYYYFSKHSDVFYHPEKYGVTVGRRQNNTRLFSNYTVKYDPEIISEWKRIRTFLKQNQKALKHRTMWPNNFLARKDWVYHQFK